MKQGAVELAVDRSSTTDLAHNDVRRVLALAAREVPASFAINLLRSLAQLQYVSSAPTMIGGDPIE